MSVRMDEEVARRQVYRLAWKWRMTGARGSGPWVWDLDRVRALRESLSARTGMRADHWVEVAPARQYSLTERPAPAEGRIERLADVKTHNEMVL